ncbi:MAG: hypothetical protein A2W19_08700 [Spirochaetes bacterium RBG_16_49_21]|nr:MAG: hypothetical protein A2W19_08700 [Spirochaetes bacterium RBG_16_49_21]
MEGIKIRVFCYSGHTAHERPVSFNLGEKRYNITGLLDRWYGPDYLYFKVIADDGNRYILRYDEAMDEWELEFFQKQ